MIQALFVKFPSKKTLWYNDFAFGIRKNQTAKLSITSKVI
jgi:hypothetical protein